MTVTPEAMEQARRALKVFRGLQPVLTTYARVLTGRPDVRVVASEKSNGSTDGTKIFYRPPLSLGRNAAHEKWDCNKRDEYGVLICPACADREQILSTIYHEIAHIWKESFAETSDYDRRQVVRHALEEVDGKYAAEIQRRIENAPYDQKRTYLGLASLISPYLKLVVNALEDARINLELFRANPGAVPMFAAKTRRIFVEGVEQMDHATGEYEKKSWKDYPLNMQIVCGLFCMACEYDYSDWFRPEVVEALNDEKLQELVKKTGLLGSMSEVYAQAFPVLARMRELGYCRRDEDPEDEQTPPPPAIPDEEPDEEGESDDQDGQQDGDAEPGEQEQAEPDSGGSGGEGDEAQDAGDGGESSDGSPGEDQQGADDSPGGDDSGKTDTDNGADEASSESDGEPGKAGEPGDVDDEDSHEAEGSAGTGSETEGPSGDQGGGQELGDDGPDGDNRDAGSGPGGDESLAEGLPGSDQAGQGDSEAEAGENDSGLGDPEGGDPSGDGAAAHSPGDADDDLGGSPGLDGSDGVHTGTEPDEEPGNDADAGEDPDGPDSSEADQADSETDGEPVDTGPFTHGTTVHVKDDKPEPEPEPRPEMGTPEDVETGLIKLTDHEPPTDVDADGDLIDEEAVMKTAIIQGMYFETPSAYIESVHEYEFPEELYDSLPHECPGIAEGNGRGWTQSGLAFSSEERVARGIDGDFSVPESTIAPSLVKARIVFGANLRGKNTINLKSGRVNARHLGKRAPVDDERMMRKRSRPLKKSYFVLMGIDISDSTRGKNIVLAKQLAMAEAELLDRLGVKFSIVAHSGRFLGGALRKLDIHYYHIKKPDDAWDGRARARLEKLGPDSINLDGHSLEFYRKILDRRNETDRILHYYTDGAMPAANFAEELEVLQREIKVCRQRGYILRGIGIRTDSPTQHGLETIQLEEQADVLLVIKDLEKQLMGR